MVHQNLSTEKKSTFFKVLQSGRTNFSWMRSGLYNIQHQLLDWTQLIACLCSTAGFIEDDQYK
jgi:hypothetical protein